MGGFHIQAFWFPFPFSSHELGQDGTSFVFKIFDVNQPLFRPQNLLFVCTVEIFKSKLLSYRHPKI